MINDYFEVVRVGLVFRFTNDDLRLSVLFNWNCRFGYRMVCKWDVQAKWVTVPIFIRFFRVRSLPKLLELKTERSVVS